MWHICITGGNLLRVKLISIYIERAEVNVLTYGKSSWQVQQPALQITKKTIHHLQESKSHYQRAQQYKIKLAIRILPVHSFAIIMVTWNNNLQTLGWNRNIERLKQHGIQQQQNILEENDAKKPTLKTRTRKNVTIPENAMWIIVRVIGKGNLKYFGERTHCSQIYKRTLSSQI